MNRGKFIGLIGLLAIFSLVVIFTSNLNPFSPVEEVNGNSTEGVTYYLGECFFDEDGHYFYFHGISSPNNPTLDELLIGHLSNHGASNIQIRLVRGDTFRIRSQSFKIINYGDSWITLEEV